MADTPQSGLLAVRLVTPDRILLDATAEAVELPSMSGYMEALYGAAPLLAELGAGEVRLHGGSSGNQKFFVAWGFVEVLPERVTVLAQTAERAEDVDVPHAEAARERAQKHLKEAENTDEFDEAFQELALAEARLAIAKQQQ